MAAHYFLQLGNFELISFVTVVAVCLLLPIRFIRELWLSLISSNLNAYLQWRYPIYSIDGKMTIPGCNYIWPNGQGDKAKFMDGTTSRDFWQSKYGPVYRIWSGMTPEIVLTRPEHIQTVFKDSNKHRKADANDSGYLMGQLLGSCLGLVSGSAWKTVHAVFQSEFTRKASLKHVGLVQDQVLQQFDIIGQRDNMKKELLDPASDLKMLPFWTIVTILYGPLTDNQRHTLEKIIPIREELFRQIIMGGGSRFSISRLFPSEGHNLLAKFKPLWKAFNEDIILHGRTLDFPSPVVEMFTIVEKGGINEEQFYQSLDEILFANLDVTTGALSWNLTLLASNPEYQGKLRDEIQRAQKEGGIEAYLSNNGSLLASCILESARVKAAAAFSVPQSAPTDRLIEGFLIPAGTNFIVDSYALNISNKIWAHDGHIYRPERFAECSVSDLRYQYWRFGFGPRQCLGKYLADLILRATIVHIVTVYDLGCLGEVGRNADVWISHPQTLLACTKRPRSTPK